MRVPKCLQCGEKVIFKEDVGQWLRFRVLCTTCTGKGLKLELYTDKILPPRQWYVGIRRAAEWST